MPDFAGALKEEIVRLARKELKKELESLRKASTSYRSEIASLKRRLQTLEKQQTAPLRRAKGPVGGDQDAVAPTKFRFSAKGLAAMRAKLGLSAAGTGQLLGVSQQTVYLWEAGKSKPRPAQLQAIAALRGMGKRQLKALIAGKGVVTKKPAKKLGRKKAPAEAPRES